MGFVTTKWLATKGWKGPGRAGHVGLALGVVARIACDKFKLEPLP